MLTKTLTIAGSDASGGAGIGADLRTFQNYGTYGMQAITVLVAMDPENNWAHQVAPVDLDVIEQQINTTLYLKPHALKTGMLPTVDIIKLVGAKLREAVSTDNKPIIVIDPVMACKGEAPLFPENTTAIREELVPLADVITPNLFEAAQLADMPIITNIDEAKEAAIRIHRLGAKVVVIKAVPYEDGLIAELVFNGEAFGAFTHHHLDMGNHFSLGAGCTFSAAITAQVAKGRDHITAIADASAYVYNAIAESERLNEFTGALVPFNQALKEEK